MTVETAALTPAEIEAELRRIIGALCYGVDEAIADDVYQRVHELIRQAALPLEAERERGRVLAEDALRLIERSRVVFDYIAGDAEAYCAPQYQAYRRCRAVLWKRARAALATAGGEGAGL